MIGDVLLIEAKHERVGRELAAKIRKLTSGRVVVAIGGESGSGKSEIADSLRDVLRKEKYKVKILHMDNYYNTSPSIRTEHRRKNGMSVVGLHEIYWDVVEENIQAFRRGTSTTIPFLDLFTNQEDKLVTDFKDIDIVIVEGLYACNAPADVRVFIDVTYHETKKAQLKRGKEKMDELRQQVLEKEHQEVQRLRHKTDYFITANFSLIENTDKTKAPAAPQGRLIMLSPELPVALHRKGKELLWTERKNGMINALLSIYKAYDSVWFGTCDADAGSMAAGEKTAVRKRMQKESGWQPVFLDPGFDRKGHVSFCRNTMWPLFHYFSVYAEYRQEWWQAYNDFNRQYCQRILPSLAPGDTVWVHGYELMLLPSLIRAARPDITIGFFLHIPFPSFELFRLLPWRREILEGVLGADLIGFHTYEYTRHFLSCLSRIMGLENTLGNVYVGDRLVHTDAFHLGIDFEKFSAASGDPEVVKEVEKLETAYGDRRIVFSIDRFDVTRGIMNKLQIIRRFFRDFSEYRGKVIFRQSVLPPHGESGLRPSEKKEILAEVNDINRKFGKGKWVPIDCSFGFMPNKKLLAHYNTADVLLVTSVREGINLVAKEYLAAKGTRGGAVVLSEFTGGAEELTDAFIVNPNNADDVLRGLASALMLSEEEQKARMTRMRAALARNTVIGWAVDFTEVLKDTKAYQALVGQRMLSNKVKTQMLTDYHNAKRRLLMLDYNGTLVPHDIAAVSSPPGKKLLDILSVLASDRRNTVVVISDNEREDLDMWLGSLPIDLISSSTTWVRRARKRWECLESFTSEWKEGVRPVLEKYKDRTPGVYIREKRHALEWHFERATRELVSVRVRELMEALAGFAAQSNLQVNEGDKIIEVKNAGLYKGRALQPYLEDGRWNFLLAAGDDWTNENMFELMPENAYSVRVGMGVTKARFNIKNQEEMIVLLRDLAHIEPDA